MVLSHFSFSLVTLYIIYERFYLQLYLLHPPPSPLQTNSKRGWHISTLYCFYNADCLFNFRCWHISNIHRLLGQAKNQEHLWKKGVMESGLCLLDWWNFCHTKKMETEKEKKRNLGVLYEIHRYRGCVNISMFFSSEILKLSFIKFSVSISWDP